MLKVTINRGYAGSVVEYQDYLFFFCDIKTCFLVKNLDENRRDCVYLRIDLVVIDCYS